MDSDSTTPTVYVTLIQNSETIGRVCDICTGKKLAVYVVASSEHWATYLTCSAHVGTAAGHALKR